MIPITKPYITSLDIKLVETSVKNGWGKKKDFFINKFEFNFSKFIGAKYSLATSSCTGALTLALASLNLKKKDIIIADINWIAIISAIQINNLNPVFADIDESTWCLSPSDLKKKITKNTGAVIVTHLYGNIANIKEIKKICNENNIYLIEDAAEAMGSKLNNKYVGTFGDIGCFSFHGTKAITTGEGGMIVTNNNRIFKKIVFLNNHGISKKKQFYCEQIGFKFKISNIQAALGISQLKKIIKIIKKKRKIFFLYKKLIDKSKFFMNYETKDHYNSFWMPTIVSKNKNFKRYKFINYLKKRGVDTRVFFYPLSHFKMFKKEKNPNSYAIYKNGINLPSYYDLSPKKIAYISKCINNYFKK